MTQRLCAVRIRIVQPMTLKSCWEWSVRIPGANTLLSIGLSILVALSNVLPSFGAALSPEPTQDPQQQIAGLTRDVLLKGIDLSRFLLHYRLESASQPKTRLVRYFLAQEAGSACSLAFEIMATGQFGDNQNTPLRLNKLVLHRAFNTVQTGVIIAGSSSVLELGSNVVRELRNRKHGLNSGAAIKHYVNGLHELDELIAKRDQLVANQPGQRKELLLAEGKLLRHFRERSVYEFLIFHQDLVGVKAYENTYYFLNAATNAVAAASAVYGNRSLRNLNYGAPTNILFIVAGAMTMTTPGISLAATKIARGLARRSLLKQLGLKEIPVLDDQQLKADLDRFAELGRDVGTRHAAFGVEAEHALGVFSQADERFHSLLEFETKRIRLLRQVAVQNIFLGPAIGATLTTQGILGTAAYYHYQRPPLSLAKLQTSDRMNYAGTITGTVGTATAVGGTALLLTAAIAYREHLRRNNKLPEQLLNGRLSSLNQIEEEVKQIAPGP